MPPPWSRPEPFGAWVRLDDATLIAVDPALAQRLGVDHSARSPCAAPLELHLAVTSRCFAGCDGCYLDAQAHGQDPSFEVLCQRLEDARAAGVSTVAFGGGEPLLRHDIGQLATFARGLGLVPVMTTSGLGLTASRLPELKPFAQINISHDGIDGGYETVRGIKGASAAERAISWLAEANIPVGVNMVLTQSTLALLPETADRTANLGACEIQLLRYKPSGRAADRRYLDRRLLPEQLEQLWTMIVDLSRSRRLRVRIDCSMIPLLSSALLHSLAEPKESLKALGVFGCEAAHYLGATRIDGTPAPCSFFSVDVNHNSVLASQSIARSESTSSEPAKRSLPLINTPDNVAFHAYHASLPQPCGSCELVDICRGGCQVVSHHVMQRFAPDPECPRVVAYHQPANTMLESS